MGGLPSVRILELASPNSSAPTTTEEIETKLASNALWISVSSLLPAVEREASIALFKEAEVSGWGKRGSVGEVVVKSIVGFLLS